MTVTVSSPGMKHRVPFPDSQAARWWEDASMVPGSRASCRLGVLAFLATFAPSVLAGQTVEAR